MKDREHRAAGRVIEPAPPRRRRRCRGAAAARSRRSAPATAGSARRAPTQVTAAGSSMLPVPRMHGGERVEQPDQDRCRRRWCSNRRAAAASEPSRAAHRGVERRSAQPCAPAMVIAGRARPRSRPHARPARRHPRAGRSRAARNGREDAAAHGARRHHLDQHQHAGTPAPCRRAHRCPSLATK